MKKQIDKLEQFQIAFNSTYNETPTLLKDQDYVLRFNLLKEENEEYLEACKNNDKVEILDALTDQLYIVLGTIVSHGMQDIIEKAFNEVHASNMSKLDNDGKPIINGLNGVLDNTRPVGKVLKSNNFFEPDLKQLINN
jgi:predicted HAD superfamily Cof-like phosphohydrolase